MQGGGLPSIQLSGLPDPRSLYGLSNLPQVFSSYLGRPTLGATGFLPTAGLGAPSAAVAAVAAADPGVLSLLDSRLSRENAILVAMEKKRMLDEARLLNELELHRALSGERMQSSQRLLQSGNMMLLRGLDDNVVPAARSLSPDTDESSNSYAESESSKEHARFRVHNTGVTDLRMRQDDTWETRFDELIEFKETNRHCNVPRRYKLNPKLGVWVCSLRQQMTRGTLNKAKVERLNQIGFQWRITVIKGGQINPQIAKTDTWNDRLKLLISFKGLHGHCNVPSVHRKLSKWVQAQRRQRKLGKLSKDRKDKLAAIGFDWKHKRRVCKDADSISEEGEATAA